MYQPRKRLAHLRNGHSLTRLEAAMKRRNANGSELARAAGISKQMISVIRRGQSESIAEDSAAAIERFLNVERGTIFVYADELDALAATR